MSDELPVDVQELPTQTPEKLFASPALPTSLTLLIMLLILTQASILLMNQPAAYWLNAQSVSANLPLGFLLKGGPGLFVLGYALYLLGMGLLLWKLNRRAGLYLATFLLVVHVNALIQASRSGLVPIYEIQSSFVNGLFQDGSGACFLGLFFVFLFGRYPERIARWGKRASFVLALAWIALLSYGIARAAFPPASAWKPLAPVHSPGPRSMGAIAYDSRRQRAVLFGGVVSWDGKTPVLDPSTWEWDGQDWHEIKTNVRPPARYMNAMAYDAERGAVILYGGKGQNAALADLWEWDGQTWNQLCPVCTPAARYSHRMFYDPARQSIVIYGGFNTDKDSENKAFGEAWIWDGQSWSNFQFSTNTPGFFNSPLASDPENKRIVGFVKDSNWGGTWIWQGDQWSKPDLELQPELRMESAMLYLPSNHQIVLFGGGMEGSGAFWRNDTWLFDGQRWTQLKTPLAPPQRYASMAFYDETRQAMLIYGGEKFWRPYADLWELVLPGGN